jgi:type 1 glutamine amidotransferase
MTFLAPFFLIGLLAVSIPVIIHFLNLKKPQKIAFSTLSFFAELQKTTIRRLKLKRLLLLIIRMATIVFLALALARPFVPPSWVSGSVSGPVLYAFVVENGIRMDRIDANGPYLDQTQSLIRSVVGQSSDEDVFLLVTTHGQQVLGGVLNRERFLAHVDDLRLSGTGFVLDAKLTTLAGILSSWPGEKKVIYRITTQDGMVVDAQRDLYPEELASLPVNYVLLGAATGTNVQVSDVSIAGAVVGPGKSIPVEVTVTNASRQPVFNQFVSMEVEDRPAGQYQFDLAEGASETVLFDLVPTRSGSLTGRIILEGDQFQADNTRYFSIVVPEVRNVLLISDATDGSAAYLAAVLQAAQELQGRILLTRTTSDAYAQTQHAANYDVVVLNGVERLQEDVQDRLVRSVQSGTGLVVYPSARLDLSSYNRFFGRINAGQVTGFRGSYAGFNAIARLDRIRDGHPIIEEIFSRQDDEEIRTELPGLFYYLRFEPNDANSTRTILQSELLDPLLLEHRYGNGIVVISTLGTDPGWSSFPGNALYAPIFYRTVLFAMSSENGGFLEHKAGNPFVWSSTLSGDKVVISDGETDYLPEVRSLPDGSTLVRYTGHEWVPGHYSIRTESDEIIVATNFDISESNFYSLSDDNTIEILASRLANLQVYDQQNESIASLQQRISSVGFGFEIWYWFVLIAILLMLIELVITRWYKAETIS